MTVIEIEKYKGHEIKYCSHGEGNTESWRIYQGKELLSIMCLYSAKAAKNVIDTYLKRTGSVIPE